MTWQTASVSSEDTERLGESIGKRLKGGEVIELTSDLGGGKTTFVRGVARGLGSAELVTSPTFTISKVYKAGKLELHHFDFYRLNEPGHISHDLAEVSGRPEVITVIEWANVAHNVLPKKRLIISIKNLGDDKREFKFSCPKSLGYLVKETG